jgi:hypothetical protein
VGVAVAVGDGESVTVGVGNGLAVGLAVGLSSGFRKPRLPGELQAVSKVLSPANRKKARRLKARLARNFDIRPETF